MNCQEFSEHATEIARGAVMDAAARTTALGHAEACAACAARLEHERALTAALGATAESYCDAAAPARVEAALLAAFRAARVETAAPAAAHPFAPAATPLAPAATRENVHAFTSRFGRRARVAVAAAAIAASLLVTFAVVKRPQPQPAEPANQLAGGPSPATPQQSSAVETATNAQQPATPTGPVENPAEKLPAGDAGGRLLNGGADAGRPVRVQRAAGGASGKKGVKEPGLAFNIDGGQAVFAEGETVAATASEVAGLRGDEAALTDFVPLAAGANSAPLDGGQVVRVEAPRAALASFGLPVDARRANEMVKADLLLAHDGTAHAIRFVR